MNGMMPLEYVISEVKLKLVKLQDLLTGLYELRGPTEKSQISNAEPRPGSKSQIGGRGTGTKAPAKMRGPAAAAPVVRVVEKRGQGGVASPETLRIAHIVAGLPEPFSPKEVAAATGIEAKTAANFCTQGKLAKGWLRGKGYGKYERTTKFPLPGGEPRIARINTETEKAPHRKEAERGAMLRIKPSAAELERLQDELEAAIEERDGHQTAGRDGLLAVAQKKVDGLVARIKGS